MRSSKKVWDTLPDEGFAILLKWARRHDRDISWIIKENLKKNRLKKFAERVERVSRGLA